MRVDPKKRRSFKLDKYLLRRFFSFLIEIYQLVLSPLLGPCCRFYPSCSHYAIEALREHGLGRGTLLTLRRLAKCHPLHTGGVDLVPGTESRHRLIPESEAA